MGADDSAGVVDQNFLDAVLRLQNVLHIFCILDAVAVADEYRAVVVIAAQLAQLIGNGLQRCLAAAHLEHIDQVTVVVHMKHGLDLQHGAHKGGGSADTTAAFQIHQVVHGEPVAQMELRVLHPFVQLVQRHALIPLFASVPHQQSLTTGRAESVNYIYRPLRILFPQLLRRDDGRLVGSGQAGRKGHHQYIPSLCQMGFHGVQPAVRVDCGGLSTLTGAQSRVNFFNAVVAFILAHLPPEFHAQRNDGQIQLLIRFRPQVAAGIGHNIVVRHEVHTPENNRGNGIIRILL